MVTTPPIACNHCGVDTTNPIKHCDTSKTCPWFVCRACRWINDRAGHAMQPPPRRLPAPGA